MKLFNFSETTKASFKLFFIALFLAVMYALTCLRTANVRDSAIFDVTNDQVKPYLDLRYNSVDMCASDSKELKKEYKGYNYSNSYTCMRSVHEADKAIDNLIGLVETTPKMNQELVKLMSRPDDDHMNTDQVKIVKSLTKEFNTALVPFVEKSGEKVKSMNDFYGVPER